MGNDSFETQWSELAAVRDQGLGPYDEALTTLAAAGRRSPLTALWPFTSMNRLCLARSRFPFEEIQQGFIAFDPDGTFYVYEGGPYDDSHACVSETKDCDEAVRRLGQILDLM